jgi:hypothetical protein
MSFSNRDTSDMSFELRLEQEALVAEAGSAAGTLFETIYPIQRDSTADNDANGDSDQEEESWVHRGRHNARREARIHRVEADGSDSDGEYVPESHEAQTIEQLNRIIQLETAQGNVPEADQEIFEEFFGDRYRRPTSPTGRGWQNTARIAAGERINNEIYGPSINAIIDTSLMEPFFISAGPPPGLCASRRVHQQRIDAATERVQQVAEEERTQRRLNRERTRQSNLGKMADVAEDALREHRRSHDLDAMKSELNARAMEFRGQDPAGFEGWADHITVAHACSASKSRQYQIIQWYTRGVPGRVLRQVRRVELYYTTEAYLVERLLEAHVHNGARRAPDMRHHAKDDDRWAGNKKKLFFGYDPKHSVNGFPDYEPKGEGIAMIKHCAANFAARKTRLQHASAQHLPVLVSLMDEFAVEAMAALQDAEQASAGDPALQRMFDRASDPLREYRAHPPQYQPEGESSSSVAGVGGAGGNDGNESDSSGVAPILDEFENVAILLEASEARDRVLEEELRMDRENMARLRAAGLADEDEDGSASMDEGSSP